MLLIGYGNPGRGDDGLGPAFCEAMSACDFVGLEIDADYQLATEHALAVSAVDLVVFADAELGLEVPFSFREIGPEHGAALSSHAVSPGGVLALSETLYGVAPKAFVMGISAYECDQVREGLSDPARANLAAAVAYFKEWLSRLERQVVSA